MSTLFSMPRPISDSLSESKESEIFRFINTHIAYDPMIQSVKRGRCSFIKGALKRNLIFYSEATSSGLTNPSLAVREATDWFVDNLTGTGKSCIILAFPYLDSDSQIGNLWVERNQLLDRMHSKGLTGALSFRREAGGAGIESGHNEQPCTPFWVLRFL